MILAAILSAGILTMWIAPRWALSAYETSLFVLAIWTLFRKPPRRLHPVGLILAGIVGWGLLQLALDRTIYAWATWQSVLGWTVNLVAFWLAFVYCSEPRRQHRFLDAILGVTVALAVVSMFTVLTSPRGVAFWQFNVGTDLPTLGPFVYRNQYAAFVEAVLPLAVVRAIFDRRHSLLYSLAAATLFASVIVSQSRGGAIISVTEIIVLLAFAAGRGLIPWGTVAKVAVSVFACAAVLVGAIGWEALWSRFQENHSYTFRSDLARSSLAMIRDHPWTGFGLGTWSTAYPGFATFDDGSFVNQAHNDWLQWIVEGGVPLGLAMLAIAGWTVSQVLGLRRALSAPNSLWGIGMVAVFVHCLLDYPMQQRPALAAFFFALLGALAATAPSLPSNRRLENPRGDPFSVAV